jgi:hypothetical protein
MVHVTVRLRGAVEFVQGAQRSSGTDLRDKFADRDFLRNVGRGALVWRAHRILSS